ncbi:MAG: hypothetical protein CL524_00655 [Aequorivita sp.]|nr:hypothetical protein [Aequorivita sp.]
MSAFDRAWALLKIDAPIWQHPPPTEEQRQHGEELGHECVNCGCRFDNEKSPFTWDVHDPRATQECESDLGHRCKFCDFRTGEIALQNREWQRENT